MGNRENQDLREEARQPKEANDDKKAWEMAHGEGKALPYQLTKGSLPQFHAHGYPLCIHHQLSFPSRGKRKNESFSSFLEPSWTANFFPLQREPLAYSPFFESA